MALLDREFRRERRRRQESGRAIEEEYLGELRGFDPQSALEKSATGAFNVFRTQLGEAIAGLRGEQVGMGRLRTGFATEDEDRLVTRGMENLNNLIAQQALQAQGLNLNRIGMIGELGMGRSAQALEMLTSARDLEFAREQARRQEAAARHRGLGSGLGALLGGAIGSVVPGIGTEIGASIGGGLGAGIGGLF